jgi:quinoprotein glucose dehydrogenase
MKSWKKGTDGFGQGNVWSSMSVDNALDMVYLPTTSPSSDFYGGDRAGDNNYTTSIVALKGSTGEVVWHFQVVHHNVFDYDIPTEPMLIDYPLNGKSHGAMVPALVQNTKMGLIFVLNRATGEPLVPIEERPVPQQGKVDGEALSPTQPFTVGMPTIGKPGFSPDDAWGFTPIDKWLCKQEIEKLDYGPGFMPPSLRGSIQSPSSGGGPNWGGGAYDPNSHVMFVPSNHVPMVLTLIPRDKLNPAEVSDASVEGLKMTFDVKGSKYLPQIRPLLSPLGAPCSTPPWATLTAVDIVNKKILWDVPLGKIDKMSPMPMPSFFDSELGTPGAGGPLLTAGGLVFIGYTLDDRVRAFDAQTGKVLWTADLPAAGVGVPTTYEVNGEQYVVIPAGGHSMYGSTMGDSVVAYKLKR